MGRYGISLLEIGKQFGVNVMKLKFLTLSFLGGMKKRQIDVPEEDDSKFWMGILPMVWISLFFIAPLLIIFKLSFSEAVFGIPPFTEVFNATKNYMVEIKLNFKNYISVLQDSYYITAFLNSVFLAITSTVICFIIGFPMAYGIHNAKENLKTILLLLISLSFWTSLLIRIYSWMNLLSVNGITNSLLIKIGIIDSPIQFMGTYYAVCLGLVFCYLPFMIFPIYAVLEKVDKSYIESAYDLGCRPTKAFWTITIPLSKSGIVAGSILVFATSSGEFVIPELLGGPEAITFGRVLWNEFFTNLDWPMACALSMTMMFFIIMPIFIFQKKAKV